MRPRQSRTRIRLHAVNSVRKGRIWGESSSAEAHSLNEFGGIDFADVEIELANLDAGRAVVAQALEEARCAAGVRARIQASDERVLREFGKQQCVARIASSTARACLMRSDADARFRAGPRCIGELGAAAGDDSVRTSCRPGSRAETSARSYRRCARRSGWRGVGVVSRQQGVRRCPGCEALRGRVRRALAAQDATARAMPVRSTAAVEGPA